MLHAGSQSLGRTEKQAGTQSCCSGLGVSFYGVSHAYAQ